METSRSSSSSSSSSEDKCIDPRRSSPPCYQQLIYEGKTPKKVYIPIRKENGGIINFRNSLQGSLKRLGFKKNSYLDRSYFSDYFRQENEPNTFVNFYGNKQISHFLFINIQESETNNFTLNFPSYECKIHDSVLSSNKWIKQKHWWTGKKEVLTEMSWNYIDAFLHCYVNFNRHGFISNLVTKLYKKVNKNGLEKSITRLCFAFKRGKIPRIDDLTGEIIKEKSHYKAFIVHGEEDIPTVDDINVANRVIENFNSLSSA